MLNNFFEKAMAAKVAGIVIIGDEILKGHTRDTNSSFLLSHLWSLGVKVQKVATVSDDIDEIADEIKQFSSKFSIVLTSGGIGPTHDDVTIAGIAKAFGEALEYNSDMADILTKLCEAENMSVNESILKMAMLPKSATLRFPNRDSKENNKVMFPLINIHNIYVFPGVPEYLEKSFMKYSFLFHEPDCKFYLYKLYVSMDESKIAKALTEVDSTFSGSVHLGSYPCVDSKHYKVKLTLESGDLQSLDTAYELLLQHLPPRSVCYVKKYSANSRDMYKEEFRPGHRTGRLNSITDVDLAAVEATEELLKSSNHTHLASAVKTACAVLNEGFSLYEPNEICIGFNGGKDCTVALHLWLIALKMRYPRFQDKLTALYIKNEAPFPEAENFIKQTSMSYNLELLVIQSGMKEALESLHKEKPGIKACIMGTRRHDPYSSKLRSFSPTDQSWPSFMRILPILDWTYEEVWDFIKLLCIPYCNLYDKGYTSLGSQDNTLPNPLLKQSDGTFLPAFHLTDESRERDGRH